MEVFSMHYASERTARKKFLAAQDFLIRKKDHPLGWSLVRDKKIISDFFCQFHPLHNLAIYDRVITPKTQSGKFFQGIRHLLIATSWRVGLHIERFGELTIHKQPSKTVIVIHIHEIIWTKDR